ncbi:conserved Plasmodium protein, unknown function [Plasmodium ovale]|uniref:Uncharacterized protein n=1 Tax=Plasmodium ovale TaxID=36330 RepID=A0A1C3KWA1_PLAOA|nr:conserved Plasmodium protein, unknown function [Plasmodium ovale]
MKRIIILMFAAFFFAVHYHVGHCQMCTTDICEKCCYPTEDGCEKNFHKSIRGNYYSDSSYCQLCDCRNPVTGCGWIGEKFEKVKCTSCSFIKHASVRVKYFDIAGCGYQLKRGMLVSSG